MKIILATNNENKLREFREILHPIGVTVLSQREAGADIEVEETGETFEENAFLKASAVRKLTSLPVLADDSGLEVDFLNGAPGVFSARYAPDGEHCEKLLRELSGVPDDKRGARFVCVICYIDAEGKARYARGEAEGKIGREKLGGGGFGYDPVFMCEDKSFAQMTAAEKNAVSHRFKAIKEIVKLLS